MFHISPTCLISFIGQFSPVEVTVKVVSVNFVDVAPSQLEWNSEIEVAIFVIKDMANLMFECLAHS